MCVCVCVCARARACAQVHAQLAILNRMAGEDLPEKVRSKTSLEEVRNLGYLPGGRNGGSKALRWAHAGCCGYWSDEEEGGAVGGGQRRGWRPSGQGLVAAGTRAESRAEK